MDLNLVRAPGRKPWLDINANSFKISGDGSFGLNGTVTTVTGNVLLPCVSGYAPYPAPEIKANTFDVGTCFTGELSGTIQTAVLDAVSIYAYFGASRVLRCEAVFPAAIVLTSYQLEWGMQVNSLGAGGTTRGWWKLTIGTAAATQTYRGVSADPFSSVVACPISFRASFTTLNPACIITTSSGYMRRMI